MTQPPGPYDASGRPQDYVPGRDEPLYDGPPRRGGFTGFPFPGYTTTTKRGTQVTVGGCCLPLPIGCLASTLAVTAYAVSRVVRTRL